MTLIHDVARRAFCTYMRGLEEVPLCHGALHAWNNSGSWRKAEGIGGLAEDTGGLVDVALCERSQKRGHRRSSMPGFKLKCSSHSHLAMQGVVVRREK